MRHPAIAVLLASAAALLGGCRKPEPSTPGGGAGAGTAPAPEAGTAGGGAGDGKPVKIGVAGPMTGGQAKNGEDLHYGTMLAVREWNEKGGVLGRKVEVVVRDDEALDKNATVVAGELVDAGVVGVIGHFNSGCTIPASEIYHRNGVPCITPASTNTYVTDRKYADVFRVCGRDDQQGKTAADFLAGAFGAKRVAIYDDKTAYGKGLADEVARNLRGRAEVVIREGFDATERNFRPYLTKLKDAAVDVWYFGGIYEQAAPMLIQAGQLGIRAPMMSGDGVHGYQKDFLDKVGSSAEGTLTTFPYSEDPDFETRYRERMDKDPGPYAIYSYAATNILLEGIRDAGSTDGAKIAAAIHAGTFQTPVGAISFDGKGDVKAMDYYKIWVVRDGKHVLHGKE